MNKIISFFKRKLVYIPLIIVALIVGGIAIASSRNKVDYMAVAAVKQDFVQVITATGKVVSADNVDLSFESSGKISTINVRVGDKVKKGTLLATVSAEGTYAGLLGAQARLAIEQIHLQNLEAGNRPEEIQLKKTALDSANINKEQAEDILKNTIINSYASADDVIKSKINQLFYDDPNIRQENIDYREDYNTAQALNRRKSNLDLSYLNWQNSIDKLQSGTYSINDYNETLNNLSTTRSFFNDLAVVVDAYTPFSNLTQIEIDKYKLDFSSARNTVDSLITTLLIQKNAYESSLVAVKTAEDNLALSKAGSTSFDIDTQRQMVRSAEASVLQAQDQVNKNSIIAPFDGIITKVNPTVGEITSLNTPVISLISAAQYEIESFVPEADIAKIHLNDKANVTLDAYGGDTIFEAVVTKIDPAETVIASVSTYRTVLQFTAQDERIKSGMTANIDVQGQTRSNVLVVPQSSILYDDKNNKTVYILTGANNKTEIKTVKTGQTDDKGNVEIIDGINEGEMVVTNPPRK